MRSWQRFTTIEYATPYALASEISQKSDIPFNKAQELILGAGNRVRGLLGLESLPMLISGDLVQFQNFAGLLVLAPGLELEVAPKFLGDVPGWREDFFLLATLSHHGRLLDDEGLRSASKSSSDLATLIGRSLVGMYWKNQRRPLRTYQKLRYTDFAIDGDFDPEDLFNPSEEGFDQQVTTFTRANPYNAIIQAAAKQLAPVVPDAETRTRLERVGQHLPSQRLPSRLGGHKLPSRSSHWQPTFDLSLDILQGLGGAYDPKNSLAPGFVVQTWQVWEHLISIALRSSLGGKNVAVQAKQVLGRRHFDAKSVPLNVFPDVMVNVTSDSGTRRIVLDAKYKGHVDRGRLSVSNADIYEALAFSRASSVNEIVLAYPSRFNIIDPSKNEVGYANEFSKITVGEVCIRAVELGVSGISKRGGLNTFSQALSRITS